MSTKVPVLLDRRLHVRLKERLRQLAESPNGEGLPKFEGRVETGFVVSRLVEMFLNGETKIVIEQRTI